MTCPTCAAPCNSKLGCVTCFEMRRDEHIRQARVTLATMRSKYFLKEGSLVEFATRRAEHLRLGKLALETLTRKTI